MRASSASLIIITTNNYIVAIASAVVMCVRGSSYLLAVGIVGSHKIKDNETDITDKWTNRELSVAGHVWSGVWRI